MTRPSGWFYFVDTMNDFYPTSKEQVTRYQAKRLQDLIGEITQCCQEKTLYQANKFGLTQAEMKCLLLFKEERYLTVKGLAQKLEVAKSRITRIIDGLVNKKLAQRIDDPEDARVILISLTPEGQKQVEALDVYLKRPPPPVIAGTEGKRPKEYIDFPGNPAVFHGGD